MNRYPEVIELSDSEDEVVTRPTKTKKNPADYIDLTGVRHGFNPIHQRQHPSSLRRLFLPPRPAPPYRFSPSRPVTQQTTPIPKVDDTMRTLDRIAAGHHVLQLREQMTESPHEPLRDTSLAHSTSESDTDLDSPEESVRHVEVELDYDAVQKLASGLQNDMWDWEERLCQAELRQAKYDAKTRQLPKRNLATGADPFELASIRKAAKEAASVSGSELSGLTGLLPRPNQKRGTTVETPFHMKANVLPKYKAIGRVSSSFLTPNCHTQKYRPYDAEDEIHDPEVTRKYDELEQRFNNNYDSLKAQRDCQELVWLWKPWAEDLFESLQINMDHVLYYFVHDHFEPERRLTLPWSADSNMRWTLEKTAKCSTCQLEDLEEKVSLLSRNQFNALDRPDDHLLGLAGLAASAFREVTKVSLWHIVESMRLHLSENDQELDEGGAQLCAICFRHYCPDHGNFMDDFKEEDLAEQQKAYVNDEEKKHNVRQYMSLPPKDAEDHEQHVCGVFCVEPSQELQQLLGRQPNGTAGGDSRPMTQYRQALQDNELCSNGCFWDIRNRPRTRVSEVVFKPFLMVSDKDKVEKLMYFYLNNVRGPCIISRIVNIPCLSVFNHIIYRIIQKPHPTINADMLDGSTARRQQGHAKNRKMDVSRSQDLVNRPPFLPCSHKGPCQDDPKCPCFRHKVHCERFCGCDESCRRRFKGCTCVARGNKVCFKDKNCECFSANRECDPALCGKCGVIDVLNSYNKYNDDIRRGKCRNNRIQLGLPSPTTKAPSQIQGYGLYNRADISKDDFIGEYTGELISISEGDRRGAMYHVLGQEYLFTINRDQEIDASNSGNKMRFMNNSQRDEHINVEPKLLWCSGVARVGLFAKRHIKAGEELLYNYNYPESKVQYFWEPGERPANTRAVLPVSQEHVSRTAATAKVGVGMTRTLREDSSQSPLQSRPPKRKRPLEVSRRSSNEEMVDLPEIEDSEDSEFRTNGHVSEADELEDEWDDEPEAVVLPRPTVQQTNLGRDRSSKTQRSTHSRFKITGTTTVGHARKGRDQVDGTSSGPVGTGSSSRSRLLNARNGRGTLVIRRRKIGPNDRRFGGRAQQLAWQTRRMNEEAKTFGEAR